MILQDMFYRPAPYGLTVASETVADDPGFMAWRLLAVAVAPRQSAHPPKSHIHT